MSNAWDANATRVTIDTNHPKFFQLSIEDDGDGFSGEEFAELMGGGIGNSTKRTDLKPLRYGRPTIGRLGIGMLGIAQICGSFIVTSKPVSGEGFRARVNLYDLAKQRMDDPESDLVSVGTSKVGEKEFKTTIVEVGTFDFEKFDPDRLERGTRILAVDVQPTFTQSFQESLTQKVPLDWKRAITRDLTKVTSLQQLGDYWRLLWELSAACPVPYMSDDAIPEGATEALNQQLEKYHFNVQVDGRRLFKPVNLKGNPGGYTVNKFENNIIVYNNVLKYRGYIAVQEGRQLKLDELRGILIRIKNIGIGYYDQSMLDYRSNEGPRSRWVTGEIYIEEGLEDALNVDRDSFNRFHPEFRALQAHIHELLQRVVFPQVYEKIDVRSAERHKTIAAKRTQNLRETLRRHETLPVRIATRTTAPDVSAAYSGARRSARQIEVSVPAQEFIPVPKASQQLTQSILAIFELALLEEDDAERRRVFRELLIDLMKRW